jgi:hypothetical protein
MDGATVDIYDETLLGQWDTKSGLFRFQHPKYDCSYIVACRVSPKVLIERHFIVLGCVKDNCAGSCLATIMQREYAVEVHANVDTFYGEAAPAFFRTCDLRSAIELDLVNQSGQFFKDIG